MCSASSHAWGSRSPCASSVHARPRLLLGPLWVCCWACSGGCWACSWGADGGARGVLLGRRARLRHERAAVGAGVASNLLAVSEENKCGHHLREWGQLNAGRFTIEARGARGARPGWRGRQGRAGGALDTARYCQRRAAPAAGALCVAASPGGAGEGRRSGKVNLRAAPPERSRARAAREPRGLECKGVGISHRRAKA